MFASLSFQFFRFVVVRLSQQSSSRHPIRCWTEELLVHSDSNSHLLRGLSQLRRFMGVVGGDLLVVLRRIVGC